MGEGQSAALTVFGSWFDGHLDTTPKPFDLPWPEFVAALGGLFHTREGKFDPGPGFNLARFVERDGTVNRDNRHVDVLSGIVLDFDKNYDPASVFERVDGLAWLAYTTFSHTPASPRWRLVVPFSAPIPAPAYKAVRAWLLARINGNQRVNEADEQAKALSNFYFGPGCPAASADDAEWLVSDGAVLELPPLSQFKRGVPETRVLGATVDWPFLHAKMRGYKDPAIRDAFKRVLKGRPFADHGARDNTLLRMCGALAGWALSCDPRALAEVFAPSLGLMHEERPDDPPPDVEGAADKIARAQASMISKAREENEMHVEDAQSVPLVVPSSEDACATDAAAVGLDGIDDLRRHLLIRNHNVYWMWRADLGFWEGPMTEHEVQASARLELPLVPGVQVYNRKVDGGLRLKTLDELHHEYGWRADVVRYDLSAQVPRFDSGTREFVLPGAPRRELAPAYSEIVDRWLRALGGAKAERLLDWIAGLTWHDCMNSVLFLMGDPGVGKSLLARGLARVWRADQPTAMDKIAGQFNDELRSCPLVLLEEGKWDRFVDVTTMLRKLVTERSRKVNPKHLKMFELSGCIRLMVTANNFNIFANDRHPLNRADRDAIAERFFEVTPDPSARDILEAIPHGERDDLATNDVIAAHALWLAENRRPARDSKRMLVSGDKDSRFAVRIVTEDRSYGTWCVEWLARYLTNPGEFDRNYPHLLWRGVDEATGQGRVLVSPEAIVDTFEAVFKERKPQAAKISDVLRSLSTGDIRPFPNGRGRGFEVLVEEVALWSEEKGVGDPASIRASARKPHAVAGDKKPAGVIAQVPGKGRIGDVAR